MEQKRYWQRVEDLKQDPALQAALQNEDRDIPVEEILDENGSLRTNRRDFLKFFGFSVSAVALAACNQTPVKYALPFVQAPSDMVPSIPNFYASAFYDGQEVQHVLVKTRDGRPVKIEANPQSPLFGHGNNVTGAVNSRGVASILGLYDNTRLQKPTKGGVDLSWEKADAELAAAFAREAAAGRTIAVVTESVVSPSFAAAIAAFARKFPTVRHVPYDAVSASGILAANQSTFGKAVVPTYRFDRAMAVVSINADFLGSWLASTQYNRDWAIRRRVSRESAQMSKHIQFEATLSITGAASDERYPVKPSQEGLLALNLYNQIARKAGQSGYNAPALELAANSVSKSAELLWANRGKALVVAGSNDPAVQTLVNGINQMLSSYGSTIDIENPTYIRQGNDTEMAQLVADMAAGRVGAVIVHEANPAYSYADGNAFREALAKVPVRVALSSRADETASRCDYLLPDHHYLESWGDVEIQHGQLSVVQPGISAIFNTRSAISTLAKWGGAEADTYQFVRAFWDANVGKGDDYWSKTVHNGYTVDARPALAAQLSAVPRLNATRPGVSLDAAANAAARSEGNGIEVVLHEQHSIGNGKFAGNPWLLEVPDAISRIAWDQYVSINMNYAEKENIQTGDVLEISVNGKTLALPALVQPGQARDTVTVHLGLGREGDKGGKAAEGIGQNAYPLAQLVNGTLRYSAAGATVKKTGNHIDLPFVQTSLTEAGRAIVKETTLAEYQQDPYAGNKERVQLVSLWEKHPKNGHYWAMAVDLNACTGCGACVVSCYSENNIPVVGREETKRNRQMHWIRIDRYYSSPAPKEGDSFDANQAAEEFPQVSFQPMLCQHCDNAPCETVCPVLATTHSSEGLNQMTYNRCIGTRYCANNCPYKVRRFNWFDYWKQDNRGRNRPRLTLNEETMEGRDFEFNPTDDLGRMVLNPDVTVRSRGVMEKCTFCVQRLQAAKLEAKKEGRRVRDEEVQPACAQVCPSGAIIFGDLNDKDSLIAKYYNTERSYHVLEDVKTLPHVSYMTKVRNTDAAPATA